MGVFATVLVANRGEIAVRIIRTLRALGIRAATVYSEADATARHVREADVAVPIGPPPAAESYLSAPAVLAAAREVGAAAIHPGYGFLAENADFAAAVAQAGLTWIGPTPEIIAEMGDKVRARNRMAAAGVPVADGTAEPVPDLPAAQEAAARIGYPVMVKAVAGGGGIGMSVVHNDSALAAALDTARSRAERFFGAPAVFLERYLEHARHVEVQILGLDDGRVVALGERDCSVQRRHQKVLEETPSPGVTQELRERMLAAASRAGEAVGYRGAGTVECLVNPIAQDFVFLEMNARLQVEHPVTEQVTGLDLVAEQLRVAAGEPPGFDPAAPPQPRGHAIEMRVYAEDPVRFLPGPGLITRWREPAGEGIRVDAGYAEGDTVTPYYDPLLAKLVVWAPDRPAALAAARSAVARFEVIGPKVNLPFFTEVLNDESFTSGRYGTDILERMRR
ncbi:MAG: acetyl-CoA carboxylase biotin carboxylase subunit [Mycobacteriales bacterium]